MNWVQVVVEVIWRRKCVTYIYIYTYIYISTHTHTHIYIYVCKEVSRNVDKQGGEDQKMFDFVLSMYDIRFRRFLARVASPD